MEKISRMISAEFGTFEELSVAEKELLYAASWARMNASAAHSNFLVGAAILTQTDEIFTGCNVEFVHYIVAHAERNAICAMINSDARSKKIKAVAVVHGPRDARIVLPSATCAKMQYLQQIEDIEVPCGICMQDIWEYCRGDHGVRLIGRRMDGMITVTTVRDALPMRFGPEDLGISYT